MLICISIRAIWVKLISKVIFNPYYIIVLFFQEYASISATGGFRYNSPEGPIELSYTADENGFRPQVCFTVHTATRTFLKVF